MHQSKRGASSEYRAYLETFRASVDTIRDITDMERSCGAQLGTFIPKVWEKDLANRPSIFNLKQGGKDMVLLVKRTSETEKVETFRDLWERRDSGD